MTHVCVNVRECIEENDGETLCHVYEQFMMEIPLEKNSMHDIVVVVENDVVSHVQRISIFSSLWPSICIVLPSLSAMTCKTDHLILHFYHKRHTYLPCRCQKTKAMNLSCIVWEKEDLYCHDISSYTFMLTMLCFSLSYSTSNLFLLLWPDAIALSLKIYLSCWCGSRCINCTHGFKTTYFQERMCLQK